MLVIINAASSTAPRSKLETEASALNKRRRRGIVQQKPRKTSSRRKEIINHCQKDRSSQNRTCIMILGGASVQILQQKRKERLRACLKHRKVRIHQPSLKVIGRVRGMLRMHASQAQDLQSLKEAKVIIFPSIPLPSQLIIK